MGLHYHALNCTAAVNGDPRRDVMKQMSVFVTLMQLPLVGSRSINQLVVSGNSTFSLLAMTRPVFRSVSEEMPILMGFISTTNGSQCEFDIVMLWFMFHEFLLFSVVVKDTILFETKT